MAFRLLLDEDTATALADELEATGHDVERVVDVLGPGATDETVREYAAESSRIVLTHDDDFVSRPVDDHAGVFYVPDQRLSPHRVCRVVERVAAAYPDETTMQPVVFLTDDWL